MKKINVDALREYKKNIVKDTEVIVVGGMEIEVKLHTTILEKVDFAIRLYNSSLKQEGYTHVVDGALYDMSYKISLIKKYTNLTLPEDGVEAYSLIVDTGLYDYILNTIPNTETYELEKISKRYIEDKQNEYNQLYSTGLIIKGVADVIKTAMPSAEDMEGMLDNMNGFMKGLDIEKVDE